MTNVTLKETVLLLQTGTTLVKEQVRFVPCNCCINCDCDFLFLMILLIRLLQNSNYNICHRTKNIAKSLLHLVLLRIFFRNFAWMFKLKVLNYGSFGGELKL